MSSSSSLSLIIPAYNEEKDIIKAIDQNIEILKAYNIDFEIIVVNDGSIDNTRSLIENRSYDQNTVKLFSKENGGFGSAIKKGIELSDKEYIIFVPVDSPLTTDVSKKFIESLGKADILVSYRIRREGYTKRMKANSVFFHFFISKLFSIDLHDYTWIHVYKRSIFENGITIEYPGIFMLPEVLIKAKDMNLSFYEFPVAMSIRENGIATAASYKVAFYTFRDMIDFYIKRKLRKWK